MQAQLRGRGRAIMHHNVFFLRGCARKRRSPGEIISMKKRMRNSITAEEQEAYRDGVPILGQQIEQRFISEL